MGRGQRNIARALRNTGVLLFLAAQALPVRALSPTDRTCAEVVAYSHRLGSAERKQRIEEAKLDARAALSRKVWEEAFGKGGDESSRTAERSFASLRRRYAVDDKLKDGTFEIEGDKSDKVVAYCVPRATYRRARSDLRRQREETTEVLRLRFASLERTIADGDLEAASEAITPLHVELVNESLELATYTSRIDGREMPFYRWLVAWRKLARPGERFLQTMTTRAEELMAEGQLEEADRYVAEALEADRKYSPARDLRDEIQDRRLARLDLIREAERLARAGRFARADEALEEARSLGRDDPLLLDETAKLIQGQRAAFLALNPARSISVYAALGTLGVDTGAIERRLQQDTGSFAKGSQPLSFGVGGQFRLGRKTLAIVTGSWGVSQDENNFIGGAPLEFYQLYQLTAGFGFRTPRTASRSVAFQLLGGPVWESVDVNTLEPTTLSNKASQAAFFLKLSAEWQHATLFIQRGVGFRDTTGGLVGWSNSLQFGAATTF